MPCSICNTNCILFTFKENVKSTDEQSQMIEFTNAIWRKTNDDSSFHNMNGSSLSIGTRSRLSDIKTEKCSKFGQLFDHYGEPINW